MTDDVNHVHETVVAFEDLGCFDENDPIYQHAIKCVCDAFRAKAEPTLGDLLVVLSLARSLVLDADPKGAVSVIDAVCARIEAMGAG